MVTRRNPAETPSGGKPKRAKNLKSQSGGVAKRRSANSEPVGRSANPEPVGGDGWYQDADGAWCFGAGCVAFKIPTDGKPVELTFEEGCSDEVVDAATKGARRGTNYYIKPRGG